MVLVDGCVFVLLVAVGWSNIVIHCDSRPHLTMADWTLLKQARFLERCMHCADSSSLIVTLSIGLFDFS
jgi:hypothetical protein